MSINTGKRVLRIEAAAITNLIPRLNQEFKQAVNLIYKCRGKVVLTGMGKAGIIAQKISSTLSSIGVPSLYIHPAEAVHGDLGRVTRDDLVVVLSNSGQTEEIIKLIPTIRKLEAKLISLAGNHKSHLAKNSDVFLDVGVKREACPLGLAPTASTTAMLAMGDALAIAVLNKKGLKKEDFAFFHPGGNLGKKLLLKVKDIMRTGGANPLVREDMLVKGVLLAITKARSGSATVVNRGGKISGIFTDGDLRRHLGKDPDLLRRKVKEVMTKSSITVGPEKLAVKAMRILEEKKIDELPVVDEKKRPVGLLDVQDLLKAGIV